MKTEAVAKYNSSGTIHIVQKSTNRTFFEENVPYLYNMAASHMWLLNTWNVTEDEELNI